MKFCTWISEEIQLNWLATSLVSAGDEAKVACCVCLWRALLKVCEGAVRQRRLEIALMKITIFSHCRLIYPPIWSCDTSKESLRLGLSQGINQNCKKLHLQRKNSKFSCKITISKTKFLVFKIYCVFNFCRKNMQISSF